MFLVLAVGGLQAQGSLDAEELVARYHEATELRDTLLAVRTEQDLIFSTAARNNLAVALDRYMSAAEIDSEGEGGGCSRWDSDAFGDGDYKVLFECTFEHYLVHAIEAEESLAASGLLECARLALALEPGIVSPSDTEQCLQEWRENVESSENADREGLVTKAQEIFGSLNEMQQLVGQNLPFLWHEISTCLVGENQSSGNADCTNGHLVEGSPEVGDAILWALQTYQEILQRHRLLNAFRANIQDEAWVPEALRQVAQTANDGQGDDWLTLAETLALGCFWDVEIAPPINPTGEDGTAVQRNPEKCDANLTALEGWASPNDWFRIEARVSRLEEAVTPIEQWLTSFSADGGPGSGPWAEILGQPGLTDVDVEASLGLWNAWPDVIALACLPEALSLSRNLEQRLPPVEDFEKRMLDAGMSQAVLDHAELDQRQAWRRADAIAVFPERLTACHNRIFYHPDNRPYAAAIIRFRDLNLPEDEGTPPRLARQFSMEMIIGQSSCPRPNERLPVFAPPMGASSIPLGVSGTIEWDLLERDLFIASGGASSNQEGVPAAVVDALYRFGLAQAGGERGGDPGWESLGILAPMARAPERAFFDILLSAMSVERGAQPPAEAGPICGEPAPIEIVTPDPMIVPISFDQTRFPWTDQVLQLDFAAPNLAMGRASDVLDAAAAEMVEAVQAAVLDSGDLPFVALEEFVTFGPAVDPSSGETAALSCEIGSAGGIGFTCQGGIQVGGFDQPWPLATRILPTAGNVEIQLSEQIVPGDRTETVRDLLVAAIGEIASQVGGGSASGQDVRIGGMRLCMRGFTLRPGDPQWALLELDQAVFGGASGIAAAIGCGATRGRVSGVIGAGDEDHAIHGRADLTTGHRLAFSVGLDEQGAPVIALDEGAIADALIEQVITAALEEDWLEPFADLGGAALNLDLQGGDEGGIGSSVEAILTLRPTFTQSDDLLCVGPFTIPRDGQSLSLDAIGTAEAGFGQMDGGTCESNPNAFAALIPGFEHVDPDGPDLALALRASEEGLELATLRYDDGAFVFEMNQDGLQDHFAQMTGPVLDQLLAARFGVVGNWQSCTTAAERAAAAADPSQEMPLCWRVEVPLGAEELSQPACLVVQVDGQMAAPTLSLDWRRLLTEDLALNGAQSGLFQWQTAETGVGGTCLADDEHRIEPGQWALGALNLPSESGPIAGFDDAFERDSRGRVRLGLYFQDGDIGPQELVAAIRFTPDVSVETYLSGHNLRARADQELRAMLGLPHSVEIAWPADVLMGTIILAQPSPELDTAICARVETQRNASGLLVEVPSYQDVWLAYGQGEDALASCTAEQTPLSDAEILNILQELVGDQFLPDACFEEQAGSDPCFGHFNSSGRDDAGVTLTFRLIGPDDQTPIEASLTLALDGQVTVDGDLSSLPGLADRIARRAFQEMLDRLGGLQTLDLETLPRNLQDEVDRLTLLALLPGVGTSGAKGCLAIDYILANGGQFDFGTLVLGTATETGCEKDLETQRSFLAAVLASDLAITDVVIEHSDADPYATLTATVAGWPIAARLDATGLRLDEAALLQAVLGAENGRTISSNLPTLLPQTRVWAENIDISESAAWSSFAPARVDFDLCVEINGAAPCLREIGAHFRGGDTVQILGSPLDYLKLDTSRARFDEQDLDELGALIGGLGDLPFGSGLGELDLTQNAFSPPTLEERGGALILSTTITIGERTSRGFQIPVEAHLRIGADGLDISLTHGFDPGSSSLIAAARSVAMDLLGNILDQVDLDVWVQLGDAPDTVDIGWRTDSQGGYCITGVKVPETARSWADIDPDFQDVDVRRWSAAGREASERRCTGESAIVDALQQILPVDGGALPIFLDSELVQTRDGIFSAVSIAPDLFGADFGEGASLQLGYVGLTRDGFVLRPDLAGGLVQDINDRFASYLADAARELVGTLATGAIELPIGSVEFKIAEIEASACIPLGRLIPVTAAEVLPGLPDCADQSFFSIVLPLNLDLDVPFAGGFDGLEARIIVSQNGVDFEEPKSEDLRRALLSLIERASSFSPVTIAVNQLEFGEQGILADFDVSIDLQSVLEGLSARAEGLRIEGTRIYLPESIIFGTPLVVPVSPGVYFANIKGIIPLRPEGRMGVSADWLPFEGGGSILKAPLTITLRGGAETGVLDINGRLIALGFLDLYTLEGTVDPRVFSIVLDARTVGPIREIMSADARLFFDGQGQVLEVESELTVLGVNFAETLVDLNREGFHAFAQSRLGFVVGEVEFQGSFNLDDLRLAGEVKADIAGFTLASARFEADQECGASVEASVPRLGLDFGVYAPFLSDISLGSIEREVIRMAESTLKSLFGGRARRRHGPCHDDAGGVGGDDSVPPDQMVGPPGAPIEFPAESISSELADLAQSLSEVSLASAAQAVAEPAEVTETTQVDDENGRDPGNPGRTNGGPVPVSVPRSDECHGAAEIVISEDADACFVRLDESAHYAHGHSSFPWGGKPTQWGSNSGGDQRIAYNLGQLFRVCHAVTGCSEPNLDSGLETMAFGEQAVDFLSNSDSPEGWRLLTVYAHDREEEGARYQTCNGCHTPEHTGYAHNRIVMAPVVTAEGHVHRSTDRSIAVVWTTPEPDEQLPSLYLLDGMAAGPPIQLSGRAMGLLRTAAAWHGDEGQSDFEGEGPEIYPADGMALSAFAFEAAMICNEYIFGQRFRGNRIGVNGDGVLTSEFCFHQVGIDTSLSAMDYFYMSSHSDTFEPNTDQVIALAPVNDEILGGYILPHRYACGTSDENSASEEDERICTELRWVRRGEGILRPLQDGTVFEQVLRIQYDADGNPIDADGIPIDEEEPVSGHRLGRLLLMSTLETGPGNPTVMDCPTEVGPASAIVLSTRETLFHAAPNRLIQLHRDPTNSQGLTDYAADGLRAGEAVNFSGDTRHFCDPEHRTRTPIDHAVAQIVRAIAEPAGDTISDAWPEAVELQFNYATRRDGEGYVTLAATAHQFNETGGLVLGADGFTPSVLRFPNSEGEVDNFLLDSAAGEDSPRLRCLRRAVRQVRPNDAQLDPFPALDDLYEDALYSDDANRIDRQIALALDEVFSGRRADIIEGLVNCAAVE